MPMTPESFVRLLMKFSRDRDYAALARECPAGWARAVAVAYHLAVDRAGSAPVAPTAPTETTTTVTRCDRAPIDPATVVDATAQPSRTRTIPVEVLAHLTDEDVRAFFGVGRR
jgi:hypothetical protein